MKSLRLLFVLLAPMLFFACSKEKSFEVGNSLLSQWEFREGSNQFKGSVDTAYLVELGGGIKGLIFQGTADDGTGAIGIEIAAFNPSAPGVYKTPNVHFQYVKSTGVLYENDLSAADQFTVEVTEVTSEGITAVFNGKVEDSSGAIKTITDGKLKAKIINNSQPGTGQLTFWSKSLCTGGGNIAITLSNLQTGSITSVSSSAPACGASGSATFSLPAGTYGYMAKCGSSDSTIGVITVAANQCVRQEVVFGGGQPADGQVSFWAKASCTAGGNITVTLNNQTQSITSFTANAPANCASAGTANFTLPPGTHSWIAVCGTAPNVDTLRGNVTVTSGQCSKVEVVYATGPSGQYSLVNCGAITVHGTYAAGTPLTNNNNIMVQVNVTTPGAYSITTNTVNGYSFSASGNFASAGIQNVTLVGTGTPAAAGTNNFTATAGASTCNFTVPVSGSGSPTLNKWSFTQGTKTFSGEFAGSVFFDDDFFGFGKALDLYGEIPGTDTVMNLYINFPASATQPIPGTYTTTPTFGTQPTHDFYFYDDTDDIFWVRDFPPLPPQTPALTIVITSYDPTTKIVKGTFSGTAWNTAGNIVSLTNGKFEAEVIF